MESGDNNERFIRMKASTGKSLFSSHHLVYWIILSIIIPLLSPLLSLCFPVLCSAWFDCETPSCHCQVRMWSDRAQYFVSYFEVFYSTAALNNYSCVHFWEPLLPCPTVPFRGKVQYHHTVLYTSTSHSRACLPSDIVKGVVSTHKTYLRRIRSLYFTFQVQFSLP